MEPSNQLLLGFTFLALHAHTGLFEDNRVMKSRSSSWVLSQNISPVPNHASGVVHGEAF